jgi:hypothetical protein
MCGFFFSAACSVCWSSSIIDGIPASEYLGIIRKTSEWTPSDERRKKKIVGAIDQSIPESLRNTCFGVYFPQYIRTVCDPDGFNYHNRMHNDNGKCAIEYLLLSSLGMCRNLSLVYSNIIVCENKYFRVHRTTHIKGQPQSDPTKNQYTGDVITMSFSTHNIDDAIKWMLSDSPRTPKVIIADAEASSNIKKIEEKNRNIQAVMNECIFGRRRASRVDIGREHDAKSVHFKWRGSKSICPLA